MADETLKGLDREFTEEEIVAVFERLGLPIDEPASPHVPSAPPEPLILFRISGDSPPL